MWTERHGSQKFGRLPHKLRLKLDHFRQQNPILESESAAIEAFHGDVSDGLRQLLLDSGSGSEMISLLWFKLCLKHLDSVNRAFIKLVEEIDYPMGKWEAAVVHEYLYYSSNLLNRLNLISSWISHLGSARLSLSHALSLVASSKSMAIEKLKPIYPKNQRDYGPKAQRDFGDRKEEDSEQSISHGKGEVILGAIMIMKAVTSSICGTLLFGLTRDAEPHFDLEKSTAGFLDSWIVYFDLRIREEFIKRGSVLKEVKEVNDAVDNLVAASDHGDISNEIAEMETKLKELQHLLEGVEEGVNGLFLEILGRRDELLDCLRPQNQ
ncbi:hypothetical protein Nepgr_029098 [Nepenthes gracilis]|uniref:Uncharacterized protein n=1 Tax=Nepenthes gracilis TaxID=150966 RepID=A0AAD3Y4J5_NEPGR|nr:hypothetical protein Nepgr_029098 [Nepenthes gracilis]